MQQMIFIADFIACSTCFGAPLCPSSGAREYYTDGCCLWYLVLWFSSCRYGVELRVMCPVCGLLLILWSIPNKLGGIIALVISVAIQFILPTNKSKFRGTQFYPINQVLFWTITNTRTHNPQLHTIPTAWKPKHQIRQAATTFIIFSSSWWWA